MDDTIESTVLSVHQIRKFLIDKKLRLVAKGANLSYPTLKRFLTTGYEDVNFTTDTLKKISDYIRTTAYRD
jgi:hypothetical protein